jgi:hypothetical protein
MLAPNELTSMNTTTVDQVVNGVCVRGMVQKSFPSVVKQRALPQRLSLLPAGMRSWGKLHLISSATRHGRAV